MKYYNKSNSKSRLIHLNALFKMKTVLLKKYTLIEEFLPDSKIISGEKCGEN